MVNAKMSSINVPNVTIFYYTAQWAAIDSRAAGAARERRRGE